MEPDFSDWLESELIWAFEYILGKTDFSENEAAWRAHSGLKILLPDPVAVEVDDFAGGAVG